MNARHELHQKRGLSTERFWIIECRDDILTTEWGAVEGGVRKRHGRTEDTIKAKGKLGTAAFVSANENAVFNMEREIRKKMEEGYEDILSTRKQVTNGDQISHDVALFKNLAFCKPAKKPSKTVMGRHDIIGTVKFNGETVIAHRMSNGKAKIYSRRIIDITDWFPQLISFMESPAVPTKSILMFEGHMGRGATRKDALKAASIFRSKAPLALEKQEQNGWMSFYLFRAPFWDGEPYEQRYTNRDQILWMEDILSPLLRKFSWRDQKLLKPIQVVRNLTVDSALAHARANKLEGLVGYLPEACMGDQAWSFNGKPTRPNHFFKLKIDEEDDFVIKFNPEKGHGTWGTGKNQKRVGTFAMYQYGAGGTLVYCGDVGTGFSDEDREDVIAWMKSAGQTWEGVAEVRYETRFLISAGDKSNAIQLPRIVRFREDKGATECICEALIEE